MKTFLDSGVLLAAWKGSEKDAAKAVSILEDPSRQFFTAQTVRLELLPKAFFHKQSAEAELYESYFSQTVKEESLDRKLGEEAFALAKKYGLAAMDALNMAAAFRLGTEEFFTSELPGKPLFKVPGIKVISLRDVDLKSLEE